MCFNACRDIFDEYDKYDAFLILHGTDTMAFTASMLSFMLPNLNKTVVVTGSQIPLSLQRNDGVSNLLGALIIAGHFVIPEVCLYFHNKLMRGNRTSKLDSSELNAFGTPNSEPLATVGVEVRVDWDKVLPPPTMPLELNVQFESNVAVLSLYPGLDPLVLENMMRPPMRGVILRTFGAGNAPDQNPEFIRVITEASKRLVIVNVTQCISGGVAAHYATGRALIDAGVVSGRDLTVEAALTKLGHLLGQGHSLRRVRERMQESLQGELTATQTLKSSLDLEDDSFFSSVYRTMARGAHDPDSASRVTAIREALTPVLMCSAAGRGSATQLRTMLANGADPSSSDYDGRTALHLAASNGRLECVELLIEARAELSPLDRWNGTPYDDAVRHSHPDVAEALRRAGALTNAAELMSAAGGAVRSGDVASLRDAVTAHPQLLAQRNPEGRSLLHLAVELRQEDVVRALINVGMDVNFPNRDGETSLTVRCRTGVGCITSAAHSLLVVYGRFSHVQLCSGPHTHAIAELLKHAGATLTISTKKLTAAAPKPTQKRVVGPKGSGYRERMQRVAKLAVSGINTDGPVAGAGAAPDGDPASPLPSAPESASLSPSSPAWASLSPSAVSVTPKVRGAGAAAFPAVSATATSPPRLPKASSAASLLAASGSSLLNLPSLETKAASTTTLTPPMPKERTLTRSSRALAPSLASPKVGPGGGTNKSRHRRSGAPAQRRGDVVEGESPVTISKATHDATVRFKAASSEHSPSKAQRRPHR